MYEHELAKFEGYQYHNAGIISPCAAILDNSKESVQYYIDYLIENKFSVFLTNEPEMIKKFRKEKKDDVMYILDMHMRNIPDVGGVTTFQGTAVGLAVICKLTNFGRKNRIEHCAVLTEFDDNESAVDMFENLRSHGQNVERLRKGTEKDKIDKFVGAIEKYSVHYLENVKYRTLKRNVRALARAYAELSPKATVDQMEARLFGYTGVEESIWKHQSDRIIELSGQGMKERIEALAYIREAILLSFGSHDKEIQRSWIMEPRPELRNNSVWDMVTSGSIADIFEACSFVNRVLG